MTVDSFTQGLVINYEPNTVVVGLPVLVASLDVFGCCVAVACGVLAGAGWNGLGCGAGCWWG